MSIPWLRCHSRRLPPALIAACLLLTFTSHNAPAQTPDGLRTIAVKLHDPGGASIPADVRIFPDATPLPSSHGSHIFRVKPGPHDLFVHSPGFRNIAQRIEVSAPVTTVIHLTLQVWSCSQCLPPEPWDPTVVIGVNWGRYTSPRLRAEDLREFRRYPVRVQNPMTQAKEEYAGFSFAELLRRFCAPTDCAPNQSGASPTYAVVHGNVGRIMAPLSKLTSDQPEQLLIIADTLGAKRLPNDQLKVFLMENGKVIERAEGIIGMSLTRTQ